MRIWRGMLMVGLLLGGCQMGNTERVSERVQWKQGQDVGGYRLVAIKADGKAEFRNMDTGDADLQPHVLAAPGEGWGLERQIQRHRYIFDKFTVESTDGNKQEASVLVETTYSSHPQPTPEAKRR